MSNSPSPSKKMNNSLWKNNENLDFTGSNIKDERINPYACYEVSDFEEKRELEILNQMDKIPKNIKYQEQHRFIAYLNHLTYFYARISRALLYNYGNLNLEDFILSVRNYSEYKKTLRQILVKVLNIILKRLQYFSEESNNLQHIDDSIFSKVSQISVVINKYLGENDMQYDEQELKEQINFMKKQNYAQKNQLHKLQLDLQNIDNILQQFVLKQNHSLTLKIVEESQLAKVQQIEPFIGYAGKKQNLVTSYDQKQGIVSGDTLKNNDFRGIFAYGHDSDILYIGYHGSCQEYDWYANLESGLVSPQQLGLDQLPESWMIMEGFGELVSIGWHSKQDIQYNQDEKNDEEKLQQQQYSNIPTYFETFQEKLKGKKTAFFTGHSQGAGLAQLACIYTKMLLKDHGYDIRGWFISLPRTLDKTTCQEVDKIFEISQNGTDNKLIRQNVFGDPVPMAFQSCKEVFRRIRTFSSMGQVLFQEHFLQVLKVIMTDQKFLKSVKQNALQNASLQEKIQLSISSDYINQFVLKPLYSDKYNGNFSKFLLDYTGKDIDIVHKQLWNIVANVYKETILELIPQQVQEKLELKKEMITGEDLRGLLNSMARLVIVEADNMNNLEHLIFESEYQYEYQTKIYSEKQELEQSRIKSNSGLKGLWEYFNFNSKNDDKQPDELQENQHEIFCAETPSMFLSKRFIKALMMDQLEQKFYSQKLSLLGEVLEGMMYFSANFGDAGMLLLDSLDFHKGCKRVDDLRLLENFFGSQIKNIDITGIDTNLALHKSKEQILSYFAPYHYGEPDLEGSFNPELVIDSQVPRMHGYANYYKNLPEDDRVNELYRLGLVKKHQESIRYMTQNTTNDILIMKHRIEAKIYYCPYLLQELTFTGQFISKEDIQLIVNKFKSLQYSHSEQNISEEQENAELYQLVKYSFFLSSLLKALQVLYSEKSMKLERQFYHVYSNFINKVKSKKNENNLKAFCIIHEEFLKDSLNYIRNNTFS